MNFGENAVELINSDFRDLSLAANKLGGIGFGPSLFGFIAAIYLLILDRTNWRTNILTALLIPYIFFTLPSLVFNVFRGDIGKWIALVAVVLRLFIPRHFPDWLEMPVALILLIIVAPWQIANTFRNSIVGVTVCLLIALYLLQEHIQASGGYRNSFTKPNGLSNTIGIIIMLVYPIWAIVLISI